MGAPSPFAPASFPVLPSVKGIQLATAACGIKYRNRDDVLVAMSEGPCQVAGVFTHSATASENVLWGRKILPHGKARILVVSAGNANAFNGPAGKGSIQRIVASCAALWNCKEEEVYPCATGVIGVPLKDQCITDALPLLKKNLNAEGSWEAAARAIMTTDTYPKGSSRQVMVQGKKVTINGIAKGSGMIAPNMATLLAYVFTDAAIASPLLQTILQRVTDKTFNAITVDSDTSTSDTLLLFATGKAGHALISEPHDPELHVFEKALEAVMRDLAHQVVKDGEGAQKFITITVTGAASDLAAKGLAFAVANSPLVKTAIAGEDANWGRIVMALGKAGIPLQSDTISVAIGGSPIAEKSALNPHYDESKVTAHMKGREIDIAIDMGMGKGKATVWTCDLTHEYITINADYRS